MILLLVYIDMPKVSSTEIRSKVKNGHSITGLVLPEVEDYILSKGLYT